jgi:4-hydroxy-3-methylbut-2-en-1-yl diphosphate reductase
MDVVRADILGFCWGVRRALERIERALAESKPIYALHAIVHNEVVMADLQARGLVWVSSPSDIPDGATVVVAAHGVPAALLAGLQARDLAILDATCPVVRTAQRTVAENARSGRFTVIYGDREHLEVRGLLSHAGGRAEAAVSIDGLALPAGTPVTVVGQTTRSPENLEAFADELRSALGDGADVIVQDTTCAEPQARYRAVRDLAEHVDALVVVGSPTSANTHNLEEICRSSGRPTCLVDSADAIDPDGFQPGFRIGLTAGTSTPDTAIDAVEDRLRSL